MTQKEKILLIDDEAGLLTMLSITLYKEHFRNIHTASTGTGALRLIKENEYDLIILDVVLSDCNGFELCSKIRHYTDAPIIFLSARSSDFDKLTGLALGGDDYITKPFNTMELVARMKALFRRQRMTQRRVDMLKDDVNIFDYGHIVILPEQGIVKVNSTEVCCTAKEMKLLTFFCRNPNRIFSVSYLYDIVWGINAVGDEKTVGIHISKIRKKLLDISYPPKIITSIRGMGYKFIPPVRNSK